MEKQDIVEQIDRLKHGKNAIILAHYYQNPDIQEIADRLGDSLGLAQQAKESDADVIVFCGVHFMAESAAILNPEKTILLPTLSAGCPMADMADAEGLRTLKSEHPEAEVVCYVNTSAETKAESDICCTSANVIKVVKSVPSGQIIFVPDKNLAHYASRFTEKEMIPWQGYCPVHDVVTARDIQDIMEEHPGAKVVAHPECRPEVIDLADYVCSTSGMFKFAGEAEAEDIIVCTEGGLRESLSGAYPGKNFILASSKLICQTMKMITLETVLFSLTTMENKITVSEDIRNKALLSLERMLAVPRD